MLGQKEVNNTACPGTLGRISGRLTGRKNILLKSKKMAGILVYATVADIAGSLGGIIESGEPGTFLSIMEDIFKKALCI